MVEYWSRYYEGHDGLVSCEGDVSVRSGAGEECHVSWYVLECGVRTRHGVWNVHSVWCVYVCVSMCPCLHSSAACFLWSFVS